MERHFPILPAFDVTAADQGVIWLTISPLRVRTVGQEGDAGERFDHRLGIEFDVPPAIAAFDCGGDVLTREGAAHLGECHQAGVVEIATIEIGIAGPEFLFQGEKIFACCHLPGSAVRPPLGQRPGAERVPRPPNRSG
jgi:hypothetical protein